MKTDFITIGGATDDITFCTKEGVMINNKNDILRQKLLAFEYGAKIKIDVAKSYFGGGAANAAVCLALLGFKSAALVALGDDARGDEIVANFEKHNVDTGPIQRIKNMETGFSLILVGKSNEHILFSNRAANTRLSIGKKEVRYIKNAEWAYITSLSGDWQKNLKAIFRIKGPKIAWNPGHIQLNYGVKALGQYLKRAEVVTLNKDEATELVVSSPKYKNKSWDYLEKMENLLKIIKSWGPKIVVITNGKHGANAYNGIRFYHQPILKEKKIADTTGVGDAFGSTFIAGLKLFNYDIQKAMYISARNTASLVGQPGAQNGLLTKNQILKNIK